MRLRYRDSGNTTAVPGRVNIRTAPNASPAVHTAAPQRRRAIGRRPPLAGVGAHLVGNGFARPLTPCGLPASARRPGRVDVCEAAHLPGDREQVVCGVERLLGGVNLVEHGTD